MKMLKTVFTRSATALCFAFAALIGTSSAQAADGLGLESNSGSDFLPVAEAYKVAVDVQKEQIVLNWDIAPGYYLYKDKFRLSAKTPTFSDKLNAVYEPGKVKFDQYFNKDVESYYGGTKIVIPTGSLPKEFELKVRSQGCADAGLCYAPRSQYFQINSDFGTAVESKKSQIVEGSSENATTASSDNANLAATETTATETPNHSLFVYLLLAMGGGLILNLMPCVFPVLSLKALTFASSSGTGHSHHMHGWAYTAGVIGSFLVVAMFILIARSAGESAGWGFQLQSPVFVAAVMYLFLIMGLSLSGMVHFGTSLMGVGQGLTANEGLRGSFFTGVLAAVVASPCTGPMMAPALGFALTQPAIISLSIFVALGFGMALPFLLLSYSPRLANMLPRPGTWMEKLKELLAFPMYITSAWLLFVFGQQVGMVGVFFLVLGGIALTFAIWLFQNQPEGFKGRWFVKGTAMASLVFAGHVAYNSEDYRNTNEDGWQPYSAELVQELRAKGQPVFVDFTADWCITCKANESVALSRDGFRDKVKKHNFALVKGDWTNEDPRITKVLKQFNRSGVPLYLVYPSDLSKGPEVLPQLLTQDIVLSAMGRAIDGQNTSVAGK